MGVKTDRLPIPFELYRIEEMQSYFEDMSAKGHHVRRLGRTSNDFEVGEPETLRYRIEIAKKFFGGLGREQIEFYKEAGWESVGWIDNYHLFLSRESASPELHSDPFELSMVVKGLESKMKRKVVTNLFLYVLYSLFLVFWLRRDYFYDSRFLTFILVSTTILILVYEAYQHIHRLRYLNDLKDRLAHGEDMRISAPYTNLMRQYRFARYLYVAWRITFIAMQFSLIYSY